MCYNGQTFVNVINVIIVLYSVIMDIIYSKCYNSVIMVGGFADEGRLGWRLISTLSAEENALLCRGAPRRLLWRTTSSGAC